LKVLEKDMLSVSNSTPSINVVRPVTPVTIMNAPPQSSSSIYTAQAASSSSSSLLLDNAPMNQLTTTNTPNNAIPFNEKHSSHTSPSMNPVGSLSHQFMSVNIASVNTASVNTATPIAIPTGYTESSSPSLLPSNFGQSPSVSTINHTSTDNNSYIANSVPPSSFSYHLLQEPSWNITSMSPLMARSTSEELTTVPSSNFTSNSNTINTQPTQYSVYSNRYGHRQSLSAHTSPSIDPFAPLEYKSIDSRRDTKNTRFNPLQYFHERSHSDSFSASKLPLQTSTASNTSNSYYLSSLPPTALLSNHTVVDDKPYYFPDATNEPASTFSRSNSPFYFA
jgi:hypothetical protein